MRSGAYCFSLNSAAITAKKERRERGEVRFTCIRTSCRNGVYRSLSKVAGNQQVYSTRAYLSFTWLSKGAAMMSHEMGQKWGPGQPVGHGKSRTPSRNESDEGEIQIKHLQIYTAIYLLNMMAHWVCDTKIVYWWISWDVGLCHKVTTKCEELLVQICPEVCCDAWPLHGLVSWSGDWPDCYVLCAPSGARIWYVPWTGYSPDMACKTSERGFAEVCCEGWYKFHWAE